MSHVAYNGFVELDYPWFGHRGRFDDRTVPLQCYSPRRSQDAFTRPA